MHWVPRQSQGTSVFGVITKRERIFLMTHFLALTSQNMIANYVSKSRRLASIKTNRPNRIGKRESL
jgi:hypothetical protein